MADEGMIAQALDISIFRAMIYHCGVLRPDTAPTRGPFPFLEAGRPESPVTWRQRCGTGAEKGTHPVPVSRSSFGGGWVAQR